MRHRVKGLFPRFDWLTWSQYKHVQGSCRLWKAVKTAQRSLQTGKEKGELHCRWTVLPRRQEQCLLLGVFRFSCVIALGGFSTVTDLFYFLK